MSESLDATVTPSSWRPASIILDSGVAEIRIQATIEQLRPLATSLSEQRAQVLALLNLKRARVEAIPNLELGESLISAELESQLPAGFLDNDSLHIATWTGTTDTAQSEASAKMLNSDAATLIFTDWDREQFIEQRKLFWGWMLRPSTLQFQFRKGTKHLVDQIIGPELEFLTWDPAAKLFVLYTTALQAPTRLALLNQFA